MIMPIKRLTWKRAIWTTPDLRQTVIRFHPTQPALLAVGSYTGGISIHNLANSSSGAIDAVSVGHSEPVTGLEWVSSSALSRYAICYSVHFSLLT